MARAVELTTLSARLEPAFALLADVARHPTFAPEEIERQRRQTLDELRLALEEPGTVAKLAAARVAPRRAVSTRIRAKGTLASLQRLHREEIAAFHATTTLPARRCSIIAGNITAEAAFALAEKTFGDWKPTPDTAARRSCAIRARREAARRAHRHAECRPGRRRRRRARGIARERRRLLRRASSPMPCSAAATPRG